MNTPDVIKNRKISSSWTKEQRENALRILEADKQDMTELEFGQEYMGLFLEELTQLFSDDLIQERMTINYREQILPTRGINFSGYDIAAMGGDEIVHIGLNRNDRNHITQIEQIVKVKQMITSTVRDILANDKIHNYWRMGIDDGGIGVGVFHPLLEHHQTKRKIIALNNASRDLDHRGEKKKTILKEDMYLYLLWLMESKKIDLWKSDKLLQSLRSVQAEVKKGKYIIHGKYTHIAEALIRAAWLTKGKHLKLWIR